MRRCTRCVLPESCANIDFDGSGLCNFCRCYEQVGPVLEDYDALGPLLAQRFERVRGKQSYDCLIGLSGGKDSSYVAYRVTRHHGLRALLVTYDNGFLTDYARRNIELMAERLGQDHVFLRPPEGYHREIYRGSMRKFGVPCIGCTFPGMLLCMKLAVEQQIPLLIHGRSPAQMFKELTEGTYDPFLHVIRGNLAPYDAVANKRVVLSVVHRMIRLLHSFVKDRDLRRRAPEVFHPDLDQIKNADHAPEFLGLFVYEPYDELRIMDEMERELGWRRPETSAILTHEDCRIHHAAAHFYNDVCGLPIVAQEISTMVRRGEIPRDRALERLLSDQQVESPKAQAALLGEIAGLSEQQLLRTVRWGAWKMEVFKFFLQARKAARWGQNPPLDR